MATVALHTVLKAGREHEYDTVHRSIPPDVVDALRENGVSDWRIWRDGRHVFHLVEVEDYQAMRSALRDHPANIAWQQQVGPLFEIADSYEGGDSGIAFLWSLTRQASNERAG
jgi:L-rhamnose mutarotase